MANNKTVFHNLSRYQLDNLIKYEQSKIKERVLMSRKIEYFEGIDELKIGEIEQYKLKDLINEISIQQK